VWGNQLPHPVSIPAHPHQVSRSSQLAAGDTFGGTGPQLQLDALGEAGCVKFRKRCGAVRAARGVVSERPARRAVSLHTGEDARLLLLRRPADAVPLSVQIWVAAPG